MSFTPIKTTIHQARKTYYCNAYETLDAATWHDLDEPLTFAELRSIAKVKAQGGKILPGETYLRTIGKLDGEFCVFVMHKSINDICKRLDLYND